MNEPNDSPKDYKIVWAIHEQPGKRARWTRVGAAFENRDGSLTLLLDAVPIHGRLQVREKSEWDEAPRKRALPEQLAG